MAPENACDSRRRNRLDGQRVILLWETGQFPARYYPRALGMNRLHRLRGPTLRSARAAHAEVLWRPLLPLEQERAAELTDALAFTTMQ